MLGCLPLSLAFGIVGMAADTIKWPAIVTGIIAFLLCMLLFGIPILSSLCS